MVFLFELSDLGTIDQLILANLPGKYIRQIYFYIAVNFYIAGKNGQNYLGAVSI